MKHEFYDVKAKAKVTAEITDFVTYGEEGRKREGSALRGFFFAGRREDACPGCEEEDDDVARRRSVRFRSAETGKGGRRLFRPRKEKDRRRILSFVVGRKVAASS